jgi:hypothetical protein
MPPRSCIAFPTISTDSLQAYDFDLIAASVPVGDGFDGSQLAPPDHHPLDQPTPGPAGRVPADWQQLLH